MVPKTDYYSEDKWANRNQHLYHREKLSLGIVSPILKPNSKILDVGCGDCSFLHALSKKNPEAKFYGVDNSEFQIKKAKQSNPQFQVSQGDLETSWHFESNFFDFVYGAEIIEHVFNPDLFLSEANRILKPGAHLMITTPNLCAWFNRLIFPLGFQPFFYETSTKSKLIGSGFFKKLKTGETPVGHVRIFNIDAIRDLLEDNGFEVLKVKGSIFDSAFPRWLLSIDKLFTIYPPFSASFVILARKKS